MPQDLGEYQPGSILRVRMKNFMSYDDAELVAGPKLNMVIGPNGSGKSSFVCALAIGLAGKVNVMQRAKDLNGFVKEDKKEALVEIDLYDPQVKKSKIAQIVCKVKRDVKSGSRSFTFCGETIKEKDLTALLKDRYTTQIDSFCQFLPQEKVSQFSSLNEHELLDETIRAICGENTLDQKKKLILEKEELERDGSVFQNKQKEFDSNKAMLQDMEQDVEAAKVYNEKKKQEEELRALLLCAEYHQTKEAVEQKREEYAESVAKFNQLMTKEEEKKARLEKMKIEAGPNATSQKLERARDHTKALRSGLKQGRKSVEDSLDEISNWRTEQEALEHDLKIEKSTLEKYQKSLQGFLKEHGTLEQLSEKARKMKAESAAIRKGNQKKQAVLDRTKNEIQELKNDIGGIDALVRNTKSKLQGKDVRINSLYGNLRDTIKAHYQIYKHMKESGKFNGEVYLVLTDVNATSTVNAWNIERCVRPKTMRYFITTSQQDKDLLMDHKTKPDFSVINVNAISEPNRSLSPELQREMDVVYLDTLINAPPAVVQALRTLVGAHTYVVGTQRTEEWRERNPQKFRTLMSGMTVLTPRMTIRLKKSPFRDTIIEQVDQLKKQDMDQRPKILKSHGNEELERRIEDLEKQKEQKLAELKSPEITLQNLEEEMKGVNEDIRKAEAESKAAAKHLTDGDSLSEHVKNATKKVESLLEKSKDFDLSKLNDSVRSTWSKMNSFESQYRTSAKFFSDCAEDQGKSLKSWAKRVEQMSEQIHLEEQLKRLETELKTMRKAVDRVQKERANLKASLKQQREVINRLNVNRETNERARERDIPQLKSELKLLRAWLENTTVDRSVLDRYKALKAKVETAEVELEQEKAQRSSREVAYSDNMSKWLMEVQSTVTDVDSFFKAGFETAGKDGFNGKGIVELIKDPADDKNIAKFGIGVSVSFREDKEPSRLNAQSQSGGERSLSTFLYLLAMNEAKGKLPFRVVDEINQGMDESRERISLRQLMVSSCGPFDGSNNVRPQFFLITPKLLFGIKYHPSTTVHFVFNGNGAVKQEKFFTEKLLEAASKNAKRPHGESSSHSSKRTKR